MDSLAEMEIRIRLLQSELTNVRQALAEREAQDAQRTGSENDLNRGLDDIRQRLTSLPERLSELCPEAPRSATVTTQCEDRPEVRRVVVNGDKLVVGEAERVWLEPPSVFLTARVDAAAEHSLVRAEEPVEFERDGNRWIRFGVTADEETVSVERPLKRFTRIGDSRRPVVELRVQLGDLREAVEFVVSALPAEEHALVLGRNFLTDVALVDVARQFVQPAFQRPSE